MARTLARSLAWIAVLAVLMAGGLFFKFLKDALSPYVGTGVDWLVSALGPNAYLLEYATWTFLIVGSIWFVYGGFIRKEPTD